MTIIVCPTEKCNFRCTACFEPESERIHSETPYSFEAIQGGLNEIWSGPYQGSDVCLHGGEPTLIPTHEFEKLLSLIYNLPWKKQDGTMGIKGSVSIVTNGSTVTDQMIELFKKYNVYVGISKDGPTELNVYRGPDPTDGKVTQEYNEKLWETIKKLRRHNIPVNIMCILHKKNAGTVEQLKTMYRWLLSLKKIGIKGGRLNPMYSNAHPEVELTTDELYRAWNFFYRINKRHDLNWNPLQEMEKNLKGEKRASVSHFTPGPCSFNRCDLFNTHTISVLPDGRIGNCDRTFAHGTYQRSRERGKSGRYEALKQTECKGCRYWPVCGGGCPEEGRDGDWRNKTRFCEAIKRIYGYIEDKLVEDDPLVSLVVGQPEEYEPIGNVPHGDAAHGDSAHGDAGHGDAMHGDAPHGDLPHGDSSHGDSPDWV